MPAHAIASQHVWRHDADDQPVYYESSHTDIFRVGLNPDAVLRFRQGVAQIDSGSLKRFDYAVLGFATTKVGLVAPFDEEDTREVFKVERCDEFGGDLFAYWQRHCNQDLFSGKRVDFQTFESSN